MDTFDCTLRARRAQYLLPVSLVWARYAALGTVLRASFASRASARAKAPTVQLGQPLGPWEHYSALGSPCPGCAANREPSSSTSRCRRRRTNRGELVECRRLRSPAWGWVALGTDAATGCEVYFVELRGAA